MTNAPAPEIVVEQKYQALMQMLDRDIEREGLWHSFMVRAGLLKEIIEAAAKAERERDMLRERWREELNRGVVLTSQLSVANQGKTKAEADLARAVDAIDKWIAYNNLDEADFSKVHPVLRYAEAINASREFVSTLNPDDNEARSG